MSLKVKSNNKRKGEGKMTNKERRDAQMAYISDDEVMEEQKRSRRLTQQVKYYGPLGF